MIEVRRIRATDSELNNLICNLMTSEYAKGDQSGQAFTITDMTYISVKPVKLSVSGQFSDGRPVTMVVTPDLLIASFVVFCTGGGIPISRQSVKSVAKVDDGIAFDMVVRNLEVAETASAHQIRYGFLPAGHDDMGINMAQHLR